MEVPSPFVGMLQVLLGLISMRSIDRISHELVFFKNSMRLICLFRKGDRGTNSVCGKKEGFLAERKGVLDRDTLSISQSKQANTV